MKLVALPGRLELIQKEIYIGKKVIQKLYLPPTTEYVWRYFNERKIPLSVLVYLEHIPQEESRIKAQLLSRLY